jgi:hypothetical protein
MQSINFFAVVVAATSAFLLGGLWYSPMLFGLLWAREANQPAQQGHPARVFVVAFVFALISAVPFAYWLGPDPSLENALRFGVLAGGFLVAASFGINYQFARRSSLLWLIDGGYHVAQFGLYGLILGLWH